MGSSCFGAVAIDLPSRARKRNSRPIVPAAVASVKYLNGRPRVPLSAEGGIGRLLVYCAADAPLRHGALPLALLRPTVRRPGAATLRRRGPGGRHRDVGAGA